MKECNPEIMWVTIDVKINYNKEFGLCIDFAF